MAEEMKKYTLMIQDIPIAEFLLSEESGEIEKVLTVFDSKRLPLGTTNVQGIAVRGLLNKWWVGRSIPMSRHGISSLLSHLELPASTLILSKCVDLSQGFQLV
ncbi:MAG: hypothetical protein FWF59_04115 [Turicibacter sp.]|nr:hypothetical protein [Turicibacter sp.]